MIIVDTSVWIDFFRGKNNPATEKLNTLRFNGLDIYICGIILAEILSGIKDNNKKKIVQEKLLNLRFVEPVYPDTYIGSSFIYSEGRKRGITIRSHIDCLISQLAIESHLMVLEKDRDYRQISTYTSLRLY